MINERVQGCIADTLTKKVLVLRQFRWYYAERGKSTMGWYFGFKLHLICNERGELLNFMLTKANVDDRNTDIFNRLSDNVFGKLFADKGYISHGSSHISVLPMLQKVGGR